MHLVVFIAFLVILPLWSEIKRQMYYLGSIPDPICVLKKRNPGRISHNSSATGWSKSQHLEGQATTIQVTLRGLVMRGVEPPPTLAPQPRGSWGQRSSCTVPKYKPTLFLAYRHHGQQSFLHELGRSSRNWENSWQSVTAANFKIKSMKKLATAKAERGPSRKVGRTPFKHVCIIRSQVSSRSFQGPCLIHSILLPQEFCPISLPVSVD